MNLVLGEKPSVAQSLAKVLGAKNRKDGYLEGNGWIVSWCLGHLAEYVPPEVYDEKYQKWEFADLPILPEVWELSVAKDKKAQFNVLKKLLNRSDVEYAVNGCDAGREGELIFKRVYELSGSRLPVKRLWISSLEDSAIREGFAHLKEGKDYENLCEASVCRAKADWLIGMNATRAFTTKYYKRLVVGRVQTPTLAMLVERGNQISHFQKEKYYNIHLDCGGLEVTKQKISDRAEAERLAHACNGASAVVETVVSTEKSVNPPKLYDLTTLQRESNRCYGYTAKETLDFTQSLYEKKLVTYPRTDSQYLTEDMGQTARTVIGLVCGKFGFASVYPAEPEVSRVMDNRKVSDHHAIIPTAGVGNVQLSDMSKGEKDILLLISVRLLCATAQKHTFTETEVMVSCAGKHFTAKGRVIKENGWKAVEAAFRQSQGVKNTGNGESATLPPVTEGTVIKNVAADVTEHFTSPPKPYSEDTLLSAMETAGNKDFEEDTEKKGLGTPATRAGIIEKLVSSGYAVRKGKQILSTSDGAALVAVLPEYLKSAAMTAEWENRLLLIEKGQLGSGDFMQGIVELIGRMLSECSRLSDEEQGEQGRFHPREEIGRCLVCGNPVYEGKKNFYCSNRDCSFSLWKENRYLGSMGKQMDKQMVADLLAEGRTYVDDFYSQKKKRHFAAYLLIEVQDGKANFSLKFPKKKNKK